ncbi:hypothetical protein [Flavobacterium sp. N2038]|uniref:hypothetical protein n=1 Tax=Flavobacterium sp. N2038 TaxID=2986829 RepID=UPI0022259AC4|nr:hypothetical protein [Flavobacterium sp. N2038]
MKLPITAEDLKDDFYKSVDLVDKIGDLRIRQLIQILSKIEDQIIIEGIIQIFENEERIDSIYTDQKYAGMILKNLNPKTKESIELIIIRILKNWNKSVEELPFWLRDNYGIDNLKKALSDIEKKNLSDLESNNLETMKWFLSIKN